MALTRDVAKAKFAGWVRRTLADARDRGNTDKMIEKATGVGSSTFHRWRRADWGASGWPETDKIIKFAEGLGVDPAEAFAALGVGVRRDTAPEPADDPHIETIRRRLANPNVSREEKVAIRAQLRYLAADRPLDRDAYQQAE